MRVELSNADSREYWIAWYKECLQNIDKLRAKQDKKYEIKWRKRWFLPNRKEDEFPPKSDDILDDYPSKAGWLAEPDIKQILSMLQNPYCEIVYLTSDDLDLLGWAPR